MGTGVKDQHLLPDFQNGRRRDHHYWRDRGGNHSQWFADLDQKSSGQAVPQQLGSA